VVVDSKQRGHSLNQRLVHVYWLHQLSPSWIDTSRTASQPQG
jgi:hypothetical protein